MKSRIQDLDLGSFTHCDMEFEKELIGLMIRDLIEFQESLNSLLLSGDFPAFRTACHKMNSTLKLISDEEFMTVIDNIKRKENVSGNAAAFISICSELIDGLFVRVATQKSAVAA